MSEIILEFESFELEPDSNPPGGVLCRYDRLEIWDGFPDGKRKMSCSTQKHCSTVSSRRKSLIFLNIVLEVLVWFKQNEMGWRRKDGILFNYRQESPWLAHNSINVVIQTVPNIKQLALSQYQFLEAAYIGFNKGRTESSMLK